MSRAEPAVSLLSLAPPSGPEGVPPLPPDAFPPPSPEPRPQDPPVIREPDLPGEHIPISDGPRRGKPC